MTKAKDQCKVFHILECELWLQQNGEFTTAHPVVDGFEMYADLSARFPPLPERYSSLVLPDDWFLKKSTLKQVPNDVLATIRKSWKDIRGEVRLYAFAVAAIIMNRRREISRLQPTQVQARRASLLIDRHHPQGQPKRASMSTTPSDLVSAALPFQSFQAHRQAQRDSLPDVADKKEVEDEVKHCREALAEHRKTVATLETLLAEARKTVSTSETRLKASLERAGVAREELEDVLVDLEDAEKEYIVIHDSDDEEKVVDGISDAVLEQEDCEPSSNLINSTWLKRQTSKLSGPKDTNCIIF
jgi:hypothetical protein